MNFKFIHNNFNVLDLEKSLAFYEKALGLKEVKKNECRGRQLYSCVPWRRADSHQLELTWLRDRKEPYNLGEKRIPSRFWR